MRKVFDLFCGTGGFSKGMENLDGADFETVFGTDILPVAVETFRKNHRKAYAVDRDIRELRCEDVREQLGLKKGEVDVIVGGAPCQGLFD